MPFRGEIGRASSEQRRYGAGKLEPSAPCSTFRGIILSTSCQVRCRLHVAVALSLLLIALFGDETLALNDGLL
jgi:hypothetical protein